MTADKRESAPAEKPTSRIGWPGDGRNASEGSRPPRPVEKPLSRRRLPC